MINEKTFTKEWILKKSSQYSRGKKKADPILIEKVTKALHLLEELARTNLNFIFKGGTALLLLLNKMHRFSIDIDIIIEEKKQDVDMEEVLSIIIQRSNIFTHFEENKRQGTNDIPKAHYKMYYVSALDGEESYILLDILFEKSHYIKVIEKSIESDFIDYIDPAVKVTIPSIDCILGDKLTAYAPNTTGIPYGRNKELEIIKQLFDVGNLFDEMEDIDAISSTFRQMAEQELVYREKDQELTYIDVLNDIFETSKILSERGRIEKETYNQLQTGVNRIKDFIFSRNYIIESAVNSASKAAYLSLLLKHNITDFEKFNHEIDLREYVIEHPDFKKFKSILKFDPEAYFYWYKSIELLSLIEVRA
ncbi:nucleotidyl transferase AbiEii/AbiGii toxin family protein [Tissierella creatinini]|nr:nucleotidyl transferase AbiEii/AbiGii toxin family protein [Tissierella creatinini]TJX59286.1 nucleotidyl transferase AbiEii/AbiGii toxin family protein [Soehngenia saccharolytica]